MPEEIGAATSVRSAGRLARKIDLGAISDSERRASDKAVMW